MTERAAREEHAIDLSIYKRCFEASFDGVWVTDGQGYTLAINSGCERNYGISASEVVGRHVREVEAAGVFYPSAALLALQQKQRVTVTQRTRSGRVTLVTGNPVLGEQSEVQLVICNSRDITEMLVLREQLQDAQEKVSIYHAELNELRQERLRTEGIVAASPAMDRVLRQVQRIAGVDATALLLGETGVGKNLIARKIHQLSPRSSGPYLELNCGAIPETLLESELFGYEPGAFTGARREGKPGIFELANGGTLLLDEIGELPYKLQVKLLSVLQDARVTRVGGTRERSVDVRVLAATNRSLKELTEQGGFRMDLYYRLNVLTVAVPALRERRDDIYPMVHHFLSEFNRRYRVSKSIRAAAADLLLRYHWPGNVRELANTIERLVIMGEEDVIGPSSLPTEIRSMAPQPMLHACQPLKEQVAEFERQLITDAVTKHGSATRAARALGISQSSALRRLRQK